MAEDMDAAAVPAGGGGSPLLCGRSSILCSEPSVDASNVELMCSRAKLVHAKNSYECEYLHNYFLGRQPVLLREKDVRPSINNKVVENRAYQIAKDRADALVGEPVTYSVRGTGATGHREAQASTSETDELSHKVQRLNDACVAADKHASDLELAQWLCECGVGYRIVLPNPDEATRGERPFMTASLDPRATFVVRRNDVFREPLFAGTSVRDEVTGEELTTVYTDRSRFLLRGGVLAEQGPNPLGMVPIVEYQLNPERMGVFEAVLSLFDAINEVESSRVDGVAQFVQSLMVFENVDFDHDDWEDMCRRGAVQITSTSDVAAKVYSITAELNQQQTQTLVDSFYKTALSICGMPFNVGGSGSTSDTGAAVTMRDGWSNSENRCKETEAMWKRSERLFLAAALSIMETYEHIGLGPGNVEIKFTRRNYEAIQSKAQVLTTMLGSGKIHPRLAFEYCGMFSDPESAYDASAEYVEEQRALQQEQFESQQLLKQAQAEEATPGGDAGGDSKDGGAGDVTPAGMGKRPPSTKRSREGETE